MVRINNRNQVVFDEATGKAPTGSQLPEMVFKRGQRAGSAGPFNPESPRYCRQVKPDHAGSEQAEQTTEEDEQDKAEVQDQGQVSQKPVAHGSFPER